MKTNKLSTKLPFILVVDDYHEFKTMEKLFTRMFGVKVKVVEIVDEEITEGTYQSYVYTGNKYKSKKELKEFILKNPDRIINIK